MRPRLCPTVSLVSRLIVASVLALSACAAPRISPPPDAVAAKLTPAAAIAAIREHDAQVQTLRARFTATVRSPSQERRARGVVLVKKPDRLRLQLVSPLGLTVLNYALSGAHARMQLPLEDKTLVDAEITHSSVFSPSAFAPAFLHDHAISAAACDQHEEKAQVECTQESAGMRRSLVIGLGPAVVLSETLVTADATLPLVYSDFRSVDGMLLPFRVTAVDATGATSMQIDIERYEINPPLNDALFDVSGRAP